MRERYIGDRNGVRVMRVNSSTASAQTTVYADGLLRHAHYAVTDRLFAFSDQAPALRYAVDPNWRGATPFVVFLAPRKAPRFVTGPPSDEDWQAWLAPARKPR